jgi:heme/copper-type cytochrome/quinol oxidase subunit 4
VKRVSIEEASRQLGISKEATYKRVRRGTLAHTKDMDGRLYVYMDANPAPNDETSAEKPGSAEQGRESGLSLTLGQASTLIAAAGALIYVLGVIALWAPIAKFYTSDFDTAWYAAALFPRVVAAGQGIKQLYAPLVVLLATIAGIFGWQYFFYRTRDKGKVWRILYVNAFHLLVVVSALVAGIWWERVHYGREFSFDYAYFTKVSGLLTHTASQSPLTLGLVISVVVIVALAFALQLQWSTRLLGLEYQSESPLPKIRSDRTLAIALALVLCYVFATGILRITLLTEPTLPYADISAQKSHVDGNLLTHVDGFWYIFEDEGNHKGDLIAIPDAAVKKVQVHPRGK